MVELFEACKQQASDLERKERVRTQLQQEIQRVYAGERGRQSDSPLSFFFFFVFLFSVSCSGTAVLDRIFHEWFRVSEQRR